MKDKESFSRGWFRSIDLWVMGPARFRCATLLFFSSNFIRTHSMVSIGFLSKQINWTWRRGLVNVKQPATREMCTSVPCFKMGHPLYVPHWTFDIPHSSAASCSSSQHTQVNTFNWQWWDLNPRLLRDWSLNPAPLTTRPHYLFSCCFYQNRAEACR